MSRRSTHSNETIVAALIASDGVVSVASRALGIDLWHHIRRYPEVRAAARRTSRKAIAPDCSSHLPWTHPASPWMAGVDIQIEERDEKNIGARWGKAPRVRRAA